MGGCCPILHNQRHEKADKKVLFDLGLMKGWKERHPHRESRLSFFFLQPLEPINDVIQFWRGRRESTPHSKFSQMCRSFSLLPPSHFRLLIRLSGPIIMYITGDVSLHPSTTSLVVGPGFKTNSSYPGFPLKPRRACATCSLRGSRRDRARLHFNDGRAQALRPPRDRLIRRRLAIPP